MSRPGALLALNIRWAMKNQVSADGTISFDDVGEGPAVGRAWLWQPAVRWATLGATVVALSVVGWVERGRTQERRRVELYAHVQQADYLEDFDVIANLDQIKGGNQL